METLLLLISCPLFVISITAHVIIRIKSRTADTEAEEIYWEFEDTDPHIAACEKWSRITLSTATASALLMFISAII